MCSSTRKEVKAVCLCGSKPVMSPARATIKVPPATGAFSGPWLGDQHFLDHLFRDDLFHRDFLGNHNFLGDHNFLDLRVGVAQELSSRLSITKIETLRTIVDLVRLSNMISSKYLLLYRLCDCVFMLCYSNNPNE